MRATRCSRRISGATANRAAQRACRSVVAGRKRTDRRMRWNPLAASLREGVAGHGTDLRLNLQPASRFRPRRLAMAPPTVRNNPMHRRFLRVSGRRILSTRASSWRPLNGTPNRHCEEAEGRRRNPEFGGHEHISGSPRLLRSLAMTEVRSVQRSPASGIFDKNRKQDPRFDPMGGPQSSG